MFCYAQINEEGICEVLIDSTEMIEHPFCIPIKEYDEKYLNRKYDIAQQKWQDEYIGVEMVEQIANHLNGLTVEEKLNNIMMHLGLV